MSQPGDATPFDAGLISSITSKPSAHVCASWCHWDWEENCGADQCVWCDVCQGIMPPPASPVPPSFPPGVIGANCDETCASSEQCSDARCSRCTFCEHGFHLADAHDAPSCHPHTEYDSAHSMCSSFCDDAYGASHCELCKCKLCAFCASAPSLGPQSLKASPPPPRPSCFLGAEVVKANANNAHILFDSYQPGAEVTLDFQLAGASPSLRVTLLNDDGMHNKLFRELPSDSLQKVKFLLLPNLRSGGAQQARGPRSPDS